MPWMIAQSLVILFFGPLAAVNVISGERERGSLELLFLTPITSRALVLQKFYAAIALLSLVLVTFLPVSIVSGCRSAISPLNFLWNYLMLAAQITCTISIGLLASCRIAQTRFATAVSFIITILLSFILYGVLLPYLPGLLGCITLSDISRDYNSVSILNDRSVYLWNCALASFMPLFIIITLLCVRNCIKVIECQRNFKKAIE